ncbi:MAG: rod shape-determining protein MreD [Elusimicrobia bacterium RIFCSPLOWO2_12_FULL_59_9]|nr:MAG: rod shape-determining protein MreD [Elusimicrobia bacterium RIFCSPLOWO2_12_FULL_59_9]
MIWFFGFVSACFAHWWLVQMFPESAAPHLPLMMTIAFSIVRGPVSGQCMGFFTGLFVDTLSVRLFGGQALVLSALGYLSGQFRKKIDFNSALAQALAIFTASLAYAAAMEALSLIFMNQTLSGALTYFIGKPLTNALAGPAVFALLDKAAASRRRRLLPRAQ